MSLHERIRDLRAKLGRWPTVSDVVKHDPALLGAIHDAGYADVEDLVRDVKGEPLHHPRHGGVALVLGGASCVWEDVEKSEAMFGPEWWDTVIAVNDIGVHWPRRLDHWASLHPQKFRADPDHPKRWGWMRQRAENGHPGGYVTCAKRNPADVIIRSWGGDSGLLGVCRAYHLGHMRVVVAGMPLDKREHFAESTVHVPGRKWTAADSHWKVWLRKLNLIRERTRSMSGRTAEVLGEPTQEWIDAARTEAVA